MRIISFDCAERTLGICLMKINKISITHQEIIEQQNKIKQGLNCLINYNIDKITQMIQTKNTALVVEFATAILMVSRAINTMRALIT